MPSDEASITSDLLSEIEILERAHGLTRFPNELSNYFGCVMAVLSRYGSELGESIDFED